MVEADKKDDFQDDFEDAKDKGSGGIPQETKLEYKYVVWAMVKQQKHQMQQVDMSSTYISENKPVAEFQTVGEFWQVYSHFRRPSVMPLGTFLHFVSIYSLLLINNCFSSLMV